MSFQKTQGPGKGTAPEALTAASIVFGTTNTAPNSQANGNISNIITSGFPVHNEFTVTLSSSSPGIGSGVVSGTYGNTSVTITSSQKIIIQGGYATATYHQTKQNSGNGFGVIDQPDQTKVQHLS
jgi:hypothetical protein